MKSISSRELVEKVKQHDEEAFHVLFQQYHRLVHYIAFQLTKNEADADDIVQETFLQVQASIHNLKDPNLLKAWIGRIAHSKSITLLRKKKDQQMSDKQSDYLSNQMEVRQEFCPNEQNHHTTDMEVLHHCISQLKLPYREVLILYYFVQLSIKEICELLQLPEGTVKSRLLYGKKNLKEKIDLYERVNDVKVTFHETALESMLLTAGSAMVITSPKPAMLHFKNITIPTSTLLMSMKIIAVTTLVTGATVGGYRTYQSWNQKQSETPAIVSNEKQVHKFPEVFFEGRRIETAKEAYEILLIKAHCEAELEEMDAKQLEEISMLYETLQAYGGVYPQLITTYGWDHTALLNN